MKVKKILLMTIKYSKEIKSLMNFLMNQITKMKIKKQKKTIIKKMNQKIPLKKQKKNIN